MPWPFQRKPAQVLRLPQDVLAVKDAPRGVPDLTALGQTVEFYAAKHRQAVEDADFAARCLACWGLISNGARALAWADAALHSGNDDVAGDAAGVLVWIGIPREWEPRLRLFAESAEPVTEAIDILLEALSEGEEDAAPEAPNGRLYNGKWDAFTEHIFFTTAGLDAMVGESKRHWLGYPDQPPRRYIDLSGDLASLLAHLEPWAAPMWKELWVETANGGTACFLQHADRPNPTFANRLGADWVATAYAAPIRRNGELIRYGISSFTYKRSGKEERVVEAHQESRWNWYLEGEPLPFEDVALYEHKQIPKRLSLETINRYCWALGIDRANPYFYGPRAVLIERDTSGWAQIKNKKSAAQWLVENS